MFEISSQLDFYLFLFWLFFFNRVNTKERNICTAKLLQKSRKQFLANRQKGPYHLGQVVVWAIHLYIYFHVRRSVAFLYLHLHLFLGKSRECAEV